MIETALSSMNSVHDSREYVVDGIGNDNSLTMQQQPCNIHVSHDILLEYACAC